MVRVVARDKVLQNGTGFEEPNALAIGEGIGQGWDTAIGVDGKEPRLFLRVLADIDFLDLVRKAMVEVS